MKLKKSCYDPAFCRMGFKRFAPLGILYTLVLVLLTLSNVNLGRNLYGDITTSLHSCFQYTLLINFAYAFILVQLLLGDLYVPRLCYAIHALPVTRGGWFGTQVIQGILSIIPGILISGGLMAASMTRFRVLIPVWMGVSLLYFLFFFGLALLCGVGAGNRMGMAVLYGLANFFGLVVSWARLKIFAPLIYGMYIPNTKVFLCPMSTLLNSEIFQAHYVSQTLPAPKDGPTAYYEASFFDCESVDRIEFVPKSILTVVFFAILGCIAIFLAMKLLQHRKPECAGDLLAFPKTAPVILVLTSLCSGVVFHAVSSLFEWSIGYLMMAIGLTVGYYGCLMLQKRQVNVFTLKHFLPLAVMAAAGVLALGITGLDLFGATYRIPEADQIESVELRIPHNYYDTFYASQPEDIEKVLILHRDTLEEHRVTENARPLLERIFGNEEEALEYEKEDGSLEWTGKMFIVYTLKNGSTLCRSYQYHESIPHLDILREIFSRPEFVFNEFGLEIIPESRSDILTILDQAKLVQLNCWHGENDLGYLRDKTVDIPNREEWEQLVDAMLEDAKNGSLAQPYALHPGQDYQDYINIILPASYYDGMTNLNISIFSDCVNTLNWLVEHGYHDPI